MNERRSIKTASNDGTVQAVPHRYPVTVELNTRKIHFQASGDRPEAVDLNFILRAQTIVTMRPF
jgi:hypothetical protein